MDKFDYYYDGKEGSFIITKNGNRLLECSGSEADTQHIVQLLRKDAEKEIEIQHVEYDDEQMGREK